MKKVIAIAVTATVEITAVAIGINALKAKGAKKLSRQLPFSLTRIALKKPFLQISL